MLRSQEFLSRTIHNTHKYYTSINSESSREVAYL